MAERRLNRRMKMVLPLKAAIADEKVMVHTIDISSKGARIGGLREELPPGQLVSLTRGTKKAQFKIVWVKRLDKHECQAGLEALGSQEDFWGVDLDAQDREKKESMEALLELLKGGKG